jgi:PST family polysaccharide transporter
MLRFGGYLTAFNFLNYFARNLDKVLLGRFWGAAPLGLYTRAYGLMMLPVGLVSGPISCVMIPALSKLQRDEARLREAYLRGQQIIAFGSFPIMAILLAAAEEVIAVVYGPRWSAAVPLFRVLCIAGLWQSIYSSSGQVFLASGRTDRLWRAGAAISGVLAVCLVIGLPWGPQGVAWAYSLGFCGILLPYLKYSSATVGLGLRQMGKQLWGPLVSSLTVIPAVAVAKCLMPGDLSAAFRLGVCLLVGSAAFFAVASVTCPAIMQRTFRYILAATIKLRLPNRTEPHNDEPH